ncbi:hypothetical protein SAMD00023353_7000500 [Rosellinia necatrix]|uniref:Uncharacterized protein n=1 Tax=Rosellinia necatrix TaxID=77044 RepID=A0A1W2TK01_ROSNE|nr:hypothetical protein SAMD00023353_7000500 [Rosellinia necatrix]
MLNEALDWDQRMSTAIETVERITHEKNVRRMWSIFYETGQALLATYSGAEVVYHHDAVRVPSKGGWAGELEIKMFTSPDPEVEGGVLVLCLATLGDQMDTYVTVDTNQLTDATEAIIPGVEEFASTLQGSPKVRGAILILQDNGNWKNVYWDGRRWINIIYLEWQTAESMGFVFDRE